MSEVAAETVDGEVASAMATEAPTAPATTTEAVAEETKIEKPEEEKKEKVSREKKPPKDRKPRENLSHPPYFQMIKEAILFLQDKSGSSTYAIAKHIEEKHKSVLPANFKKMLALQLKNFTAKGKLVKIKASFKLSELGKKEEKPVKSIAAARKKLKPVPKPTTASTKTRAGKKAAVKAAKKKKRGGRKGGRSATAKTKQPKSIKSPAAKKAKKVSAI
ncbi:histone H1 [Magnolia sinica]|uniref:histone H1 n=1 Tax=Magnolia sinica TaxID=86752 RepID=UPI0026591CE5|nr:histone H1 [Magnolia sinica]